MNACQHRITTSDDVNHHAASLSHWDQQYDQVSAGRFEGRLEELWLGPLQVFREHTGQAVLQRGAPGPHTLTVAAPLGGGPDEAWFCGRRVGARQLFGLVPGSGFELATRGPFDLVALGLPCAQLDAHARRCGQPLPALLATHAVFDGPPAASDRLRTLLLAALDTGRHAPPLLSAPAARQALADALCDAVIDCLGAGPRPGAAREATAATRQRVVREARKYMQDHADAPISVPMLCEALHVSRRTLQYSFQDVLQMNPVAYLRAMRLNGVRRALQAGGIEPVADRAARWGFWHPSRFTADYRQLFGEKPSDTLRRARGPGGLH